jgi:hypothetical protein
MIYSISKQINDPEMTKATELWPVSASRKIKLVNYNITTFKGIYARYKLVDKLLVWLVGGIHNVVTVLIPYEEILESFAFHGKDERMV